MEQGKHDNLNYDVYRSDTAISFSYMKHALRSYAHYEYELNKEHVQTEAMLLGSAFHSRVLTPSVFQKEYVYDIDAHKNSNAYKDFIEDCVYRGVQNIPLKMRGIPDVKKTIEDMCDAIYTHPLASKLLLHGEAEQSFCWIDEYDLKCKCRIDYIRHDDVIIDLKTCEDASYDAMQRVIAQQKYHMQGAHYCDGASAVNDRSYFEYVLLCIEKKPPYCIAVYKMDEEMLKVGRRLKKEALFTIYQAQTNPDIDKGYQCSENIIDITLPNWAG